MHPLNFYFENIFVISHPGTARHSIFLKNWPQLEFRQAKFVNKYNECSITNNIAEHILQDFPKKITLKDPLNQGQVACALAHMLIYKTIIQENLENVLILEDDAIFLNDTNLKFAMQENFDILQLWTIPEFIRQNCLPGDVTVTKYMRERASSYVVKNKNVALHLLLKQCNLMDTADGVILMSPELKYHAILPSCCNITNGVSYIWEEII